MYECSELAYNLVAENKQSKLYPRIVRGHIIELPYLGYEKALQRLCELELMVDDSFLSIIIEGKKLSFLYRMDKIQEIDFDSLENKIDFTRLNPKQLNEIEEIIARLKTGIMLDKREFEELENYLHQRNYRKKWNRSQSIGIQMDLGRVYRQMGDYELAMGYFNRILTHTRLHNLQQGLGIAMVNIAKTHFLMENYDKVREVSEQANQVFSKMDYARGMIESLTLFVKASEELGEECHDVSQQLKLIEQQHGIIAQSA